jgi:hypothetical protein
MKKVMNVAIIMNESYISSHYILKESPLMFATLLMLYRNDEKWAGVNTQGRLHQQPRKDPVNRLSWDHKAEHLK